MDTVIDLVLLAIIGMCIWAGYKKGLIMGLGGILVIIISLYGANLLSNTFSYEIVDALRPFASGYLEKKVNEEVRPAMGMGEDEFSIEDYLEAHPDQTDDFCRLSYESMGVHASAAEHMAKEAVDYADTQDASMLDAVTEVLCNRISFVIGFILMFLLILIVLTVIGNLPNLSYKLPNMERVNNIGGAALGFINGLTYCMLLTWALRFTGIVLSQETLSHTLLASWLMRINFLDGILGI
jgi:hypothetical protein